MKLEKTIEVLVLGYYGFGNLGDELLSKAVVDALVSLDIPRERIVLLSANPGRSEKLTGVKCFNRWNLGAVAALIKQSKSFLLGGGGLFQDVTSIKSCGYYWWMVRTARMSETKIWAVSQSVGPLHSILGKWFTKNALKKCSYISVRDKKTAGLLNSWNISCSIAPDLVLGMLCKRSRMSEPNLLLNLRPCYDKCAVNAVKTANFIAKNEKLKIIGVAFAKEDQVYLENLESDGTVKFKNIVTVETIDEFEQIAASASKAIGMRLHFAELCAIAGVPVAAAAYDPKVESFCAEWNLPVLGNKISDNFGVIDVMALQKIHDDIIAEFAEGWKIINK